MKSRALTPTLIAATLLLLVVFRLPLVSAETPQEKTDVANSTKMQKSPRQVLQEFCELDLHGKQLTPKGRKEVAAFFVKAGMPTLREIVIAMDCVCGRGGGMKFVVEQTDMLSTSGKPLKDIGYVMWTETHGNTADEVRDQQRQKEQDGETADSKLETAIRIYETELAKGKRLQRNVHPILDEAGVSDETKRRARRKLGIRGSQGYPWYWWLPGKEQEQEGHSPEQKIPDSEVL
jgi:hypothetical protein